MDTAPTSARCGASPRDRSPWLGAALLALVVACLGIWRVGQSGDEIYPSIQFPGFGAIPAADGAGEVAGWQVVVDTGSGVSTFTIGDLLRPAPDSAWPAALGQMAENSDDPELRAWLLERGRDLTGASCVRRTGVDARAATPDATTLAEGVDTTCGGRSEPER